MGVMGEGKNFDHWVEDDHNPEKKKEPTFITNYEDNKIHIDLD